METIIVLETFYRYNEYNYLMLTIVEVLYHWKGCIMNSIVLADLVYGTTVTSCTHSMLAYAFIDV